MYTDFVHLHCHTQNSKFDGFSAIKTFNRDEDKVLGVVAKAKELGMQGIGISDHGTVAGIIEFLKECREVKIKPILGMESYFCRNHKFKNSEEQKDGRKGNRHLLLIAKNSTGYKNLCTLSHKACIDGYYYDPRIDFELLNEHKSGMIVTSACLSSIINWNLSIDRYKEAKKAATAFKDIFHDDFYLEVMYHGIDDEAKIIPDVLKMGKELNIKVVASNDCFTKGTLVLTDQGNIPIELLEVGHKVYTHKDRLRSIQFVNKRMVDEIYTVKTIIDIAFQVTGNHPVLTVQKNGNTWEIPNWKTVETLTQNDYLLMHKHHNAVRDTNKETVRDIGDYFAIQIQEIIKEHKSVEVFNIQVDEDETYIANSYIVHNCHYTLREDSKYHDVLLCMSTKRLLKDPNRMKFSYNEFYLKSKEEMHRIFGHVPYVLSNTLEILEKCNYNDIVFVEEGGSVKLPRFDLPENFKTPFEYLEHLAMKGLHDNNFHTKPEYVQRLKQELSDIKLVWDTKRYDFATYFLVVKDIIDFANENNINSGIRGSGYGSLLLRCLGISEGDPIKSGLLWSRFLGFDDKFFISEDDLGL